MLNLWFLKFRAKRTIKRYIQWSKLEGGQVIYRGLRSINWESISYLERELKDTGEWIDFPNMVKDTKKTLQEARKVTDNETLPDLELLACFQHYGLPTFLMDFTSNPLIALWFACQDISYDILANIVDKITERKKGVTYEPVGSVDGKVYAVDASDRDKFTEAQIRSDISAFSAEGDKLYTFKPAADLSERIAAQNSVFVFGATGIKQSARERFTIRAEDKQDILTVLKHKYDIHDKTVYPKATSRLQFLARLEELIGEHHFEASWLGFNPEELCDTVDDFSRVISLNENRSAVYGTNLNNIRSDSFNNRGYAYILLKQYKKAIDDFGEAIRLKPDNAVPHYNRGIAKQKSGDEAGAQADFARARWLGFSPPDESPPPAPAA